MSIGAPSRRRFVLAEQIKRLLGVRETVKCTGRGVMKICRFTLIADRAQVPRVGLYGDEGVRDITAIAQDLAPLRWPLPLGDQLIAELPRLMPRMTQLGEAAELLDHAQVRLLSPVANPGKVICGLGNWKHHGAPLGSIGFLFKVTSAMAGPSEGVQVRWPDRVTLHEPELGIVIGSECTNVAIGDALDHVAGYTCAFDTTLQKHAEDFSFCKSFDTYGTLGPCLVTADEIPDPSGLSYRFWVDDDLRGARSFAELTGSAAELVAYASSAMTLHPGDVILSGAADVAPVGVGETMTLEIPGIGRLVAKVSLSPHARAANAGP
jgi:2-keto-4-pentenoate hydratase/2-oxohepta-3-ene-1,7-dioic acid hydratase in catechol pathway